MVNVASNVKLITSNTVPTTSNLPKGNLAFGQVNGENKIYGNIGDRVVEFTANGEPIIYFEDENDLNTFLASDDVPTGGWYAAVADKVYTSPNATMTVRSDVLRNGINPVKFSNIKTVGSLDSVKGITLEDEYTIALSGYGTGQTKFSIDATLFFRKTETEIPKLQITFYFPDSTNDVWTVASQWHAMNEQLICKDEHTVDLSAHASSRAISGDTTQVVANITPYSGPSSTSLSGTFKVEDA